MTRVVYTVLTGAGLAGILLLGLVISPIASHSSAAIPAESQISARLTMTRFMPSEAGRVKLVYQFSKASTRFGYALSYEQGSRWQMLRKVEYRGRSRGLYATTVKKLFGVRPVRPGQYRLKLSADASTRLLTFEVAWPPCSSATIGFTHVPAYGVWGDPLRGYVSCAALAKHKVAVFIYVSGWWTKPYWDSPLISIDRDGSWSTDITTGGIDEQATRIAAFLVPNGYEPPSMSGEGTLPDALYKKALDYVIVSRHPRFRTIRFSGYTWKVKTSEMPTGPGPNYFSNKPANVWVDAHGRLHLKIVKRNGRWYCSEVINSASLGYGTYTFTLANRVDRLDKNVVLGLFTWDGAAPEHNYREIDIEMSRWGDVSAENAQYVVQPWDVSGNRHRFYMKQTSPYSTHSFQWTSGSILFSSRQGHAPSLGGPIQNWTYTGDDVPPAGGENARINLWLNQKAPANGQSVEVIVESFRFRRGA